MNIVQLLTQYGLTNNEALIYESLTKLTEASAYTLSKETGIPKTSIYEILNNLKDKGLVSRSIVNNSSYFTVESPNRFLTNAVEKVDLAKMIIPEIENIVQTKNKIGPSVKFYVGEEGVKKVFEDILMTLKKMDDKKIYAIADREIENFIPRFFTEWLERREKLGIRTYLITHDNDKKISHSLFKNNNLRETRLIPKEFIFNTTMDIYANKIAIFSHKDNVPHGIIIESENVAETLRKLFDFMWKFAEIPLENINSTK